MASFHVEKRKKSSGNHVYRCTIIAKNKGIIIHRENKIFSKKEAARRWGGLRVDEIDAGVLRKGKVVTTHEMLDLYIEDNDLWSGTGRTKRYVIKMLRDCNISKIATNALKTSDLITHCRDRRGAGAGAATIYHDIAYLRSVMKKAKHIFDINTNPEVFEEAVPILIDLKLVGKSQKRTRRPTKKELEKLTAELKIRQAHQSAKIPFTDILEFSILTCMRIGEVCNLKWEDLDRKQKVITVRDRKDPRKKEGNHMLCPLLGGSFDIIQRQPETNELIFPFNSRSVTAGFQRARNQLGIEDLRYHDLRREGASRLFEMGYTIEEVAQVTGHRNINILWQIYTQLYPQKLHDKSKA